MVWKMAATTTTTPKAVDEYDTNRSFSVFMLSSVA
jgi:hypothetical protein